MRKSKLLIYSLFVVALCLDLGSTFVGVNVIRSRIVGNFVITYKETNILYDIIGDAFWPLNLTGNLCLLLTLTWAGKKIWWSYYILLIPIVVYTVCGIHNLLLLF
jgi:hypothetical protein